MPLDFAPRFWEQYHRLPTNVMRKVDKALDYLEADFRHPGLRSHPVKGHTCIYEACVDQKYRMTCERRGDLLILRNVDNHDECLREP